MAGGKKNRGKKEKLDLDHLVSTHYVDFYKERSIPLDLNIRGKTAEAKAKSRAKEMEALFEKTKVFSNEGWDNPLSYLSEVHMGATRPVILANAAGADNVLSMYANIAAVSKNMPEMLVVDRRESNLQVFDFKYLIAAMNPESRKDYVLDLFNVNPDEYETRTKGAGDVNIKTLERMLTGKAYDPKKHHASLMKKAKAVFKDERILKRFEEVSQNVTERLAKENFFHKYFVNGILKGMEWNPRTHFLLHDQLYHALTASIALPNGRKNGEFHIHTMRQDISSPSGVDALKSLVESYKIKREGVSPIDVAYIPNIEEFNALIPFLENGAAHIIKSEKDRYNAIRRLWELVDKHGLVPSDLEIHGLQRYIQREKERVPLRKIAKTETREGIPKTMFLSNLNIGYAYADYRTLEQMVEYANKSKVDEVVIGGGVYGPFFFWENKRRLIKDPRYPSLDSQLEKFKEIVDRIDAKVIYVMSENDHKVCDDLFSLYLKEKKRIEEGIKNSGLSISQQREELNSKNDNARRIIPELVFPYLLRLGQDAAKLLDEEGAGSQIVTLIDAFTKIKEQKNLSETERAALSTEHIANSPHFEVWSEYSRKTTKEQPKNSMRIFSNTRFSEVTMYKNPTDTLEEIAKMSANGTIDAQLPENTLVDLRQPLQMVKLVGGKTLIFVPDMVDDRRYFDPDFATQMQKHVLSDRVHKRISQHGLVNLPGSWVISGTHKDRMYVEPFYPKVLDTMEAVQKSGVGKKRKSYFLSHDTQINSLGERLDMFVRAMDYAFCERGCVGSIGIGDKMNMRNYKSAANEYALLKNVGVGGMQSAFRKLIMPFFELKQVEFWAEAQGNHEWNTDRDASGVDYYEGLMGAMEAHMKATGHKVELQFPNTVVGPDGGHMVSPFGSFGVGDYNIIYGHNFGERGAPSGKKKNPATIIAGWMRNMGSLAKNYDIGLMGHLHQVEMLVRDNKFCAILGSYAGSTGFEFARQLHSKPAGAIIDFYEDGHFGVEVISQDFLSQYKPKHPVVKAAGLDTFILGALKQSVQDISPVPVERAKVYTREPEYKKMPRF